MNEETIDLKPVKKVFSRIGLALCVVSAVTIVLQVIWFRIPGLGESSWGMWLGTFVPLYLVGVPLGLLVMKNLPAETPEDHPLGGKNFIIFLLIGFCLMYGGNLVGTLLSLLLSGGTAENGLMSYVMDSNPVKILMMVVLAPTIEEYIFRKQLIDRTARYGEKTAVFLSALTFGLMHQNLFQFFYAFGLGLVFAYIYTRTGRLRYSVGLHAIINFFGSVVAPLILSMVDLDALMNMDPNATEEELMLLMGDMLPGLVAYLLYALALIALAIAGLVLLILHCRKLVWREAKTPLPRGTVVQTVYRNLGMILFILLCLSMIVISLL